MSGMMRMSQEDIQDILAYLQAQSQQMRTSNADLLSPEVTQPHEPSISLPGHAAGTVNYLEKNSD